MQCAVYAMMAHTITGRDDKLTSLGHEITAHDSDSTRLRAAETMLAGTYLNNGEFELALASYERALTHAIAVGNQPGIDLVLAQRAIIEWDMGSGDDSRILLQEIEKRLSQYDEHNAKAGRGAVNTYIGLIHLYKDEAAEAVTHFRRAIGLSQEAGNTSVATSVRPGLGLALTLLGQTKEGIDHAKQGLAGVYRLKSKRLTLLAIDYCARGLLEMGRQTQAVALLERAEAVRREKKISISPTHESFCARIREKAGANFASTVPFPDDSIRTLVTDTLSILQEVESSHDRMPQIGKRSLNSQPPARLEKFLIHQVPSA
jgi:tetratricopeptide (TPR) repeat protein